jgi:hypothetical protein
VIRPPSSRHPTAPKAQLLGEIIRILSNIIVRAIGTYALFAATLVTILRNALRTNKSKDRVHARRKERYIKYKREAGQAELHYLR